MAPTCLVLGGGVGSRMRPATDTIPKPLLSVGGEPFPVHQLRWPASAGVTDGVYSTGYPGDMLPAALERRPGPRRAGPFGALDGGDVGPGERPLEGPSQLARVVAHHHLHPDVVPDGVQTLGAYERVGVDAKGRPHLAAGGDDAGFHPANV